MTIARSLSPHELTPDQRRQARERAHRYALRRLATADLLTEARERRNLLAGLHADLAAGDGSDGTPAQLRGGIEYETWHVAAIADELDRRQRAALFGYRGDLIPDASLGARFARAKAIDCAAVMAALTGETGVRAGVRTRFRCPLHDDRAPSLVCYPPGRGWWCPVCGVGGDAVALAAAMKCISAVEALRLIEGLDLGAAA